jgi:hypothetical protein
MAMAMVFLGSSCRETVKNAISDQKKSMGKDDRKKSFFSLKFFGFFFDMELPQKVCSGVFELPLLRNAQKRHKINLKIKQKSTYLLHCEAIAAKTQ